MFSETDELIGAEENIDGQIKQHFIIKESGYSWVLSYNDASALYCMSAWDMQDDKVSFFVELDTDNYYNNSGLGGLAALKVWLFDYVQGSLPRFEWFTCDVYQQEAVQRYHSMGVKKYGGLSAGTYTSMNAKPKMAFPDTRFTSAGGAQTI